MHSLIETFNFSIGYYNIIRQLLFEFDNYGTLYVKWADVTQWLTEFSRLSQTNWNVRRTYTELTVLQRKDFVC